LRDRDLWFLAGLTLAGAALRFSTLDLQSFWYDESVTVVSILQPSLADTLDQIPERESTPPLYYLIAFGWTELFGKGEAGVRSLSALIGTMTVPVAFAAGARLVSRTVGLIAAALVAASPLLVTYSQEARAYSLLVLLCALSFWAFLTALDERKTRDFALWALASAAALCTHYFAVFLLAVEAVWLLAAGPRRQALAATGAVALVGVALLPLGLHQEGDGRTDWITTIDLGHRLEETGRYFVSGAFGAPGAGLGAATFALVALGALLLALSAPRARRRALIALTVGAAALLLPLAAAAGGADFVFYRNLLPAWVPLSLALATGFACAPWRRVGTIAAALLALVYVAINVGVFRDEGYHREDWRGLAEAIGPPAGDRVVLVNPGYAHEPLSIYGRYVFELRGEPVTTREIVVAGNLDGAQLLPRFPGLESFRLVEADTVQKLGYGRYRAPRSERFTPEQPGTGARFYVELDPRG
jgi:mannosyltransferase